MNFKIKEFTDYRTLIWGSDCTPREGCVLWVSEVQIIKTVKEQVLFATREPGQF